MNRKLIPVAALIGLCLWTGSGEGQTFLKKTAAEWTKALGERDVKARQNAAFALGKLGKHAAGALPALKRILRDEKEASVRDAAAFAIGEIVKESLASDDAELPALLEQLLKNDPAPLVQRSAAYALGCLFKKAEPARAALESAISHQHPAVRQNAAWALGCLENEASIPALRKGLVDPDGLVRRDAVGALKPFKVEALKPALPDLVKCCEINDAEVRKAALLVLIKVISPKDKTAAPGIRVMLTDRDPDVRINAALVLAQIGGDEAKDAVKPLLEAMKKGDPDLRQRAAIALGSVGEAAAEAVQELRNVLGDPDEKTRDPDEQTRKYAAFALGRVKSAKAIPGLIALVARKKETVPVRMEAATSLAQIGSGKEAEDGVRTLVGVLEDRAEEYKVRERVIWALRVHQNKLKGAGEVPAMILSGFEKVLAEPRQPGVKMLYYDCAYMLGVFKGPQAPKGCLDDLRDFLREKDNAIRIYVGKKATPGVPKTPEAKAADAEVEETGEGDGRIMAVQALTFMGNQVASRDDIVKELRSIAGNNNIWSRLRTDAETLLKALGK